MTNQLRDQQRRAVDMRIPSIEKYAYCLCLHVKPTTIFIAVFKLIRALLFASILLNSEFAVNEQANDLGLPLDDRHRSTVIVVNLLTRIIMASVSAVAIYAVITGRAALLMPLYAILLLDFFFGVPSFYNRDFDPTLADNIADFRGTSPSSQYTRYSLVLFSTITMIVKIYFLCVIWKCYRYLRLIELMTPVMLPDFFSHVHQNGSQYPIVRVLGSRDSTDLSTGHNMVPPPYDSIASNMKPPNYEEAMKSSSMNFATNPTYNQQQTVVFTNLPTEQHQDVSTQVINHNDSLIRSNLEGTITGNAISDNERCTTANNTSVQETATSPTLNNSSETSESNPVMPSQSSTTSQVENTIDNPSSSKDDCPHDTVSNKPQTDSSTVTSSRDTH